MNVYLALTEVEWVRLYEYQRGQCAICEHPLRNRYAPGSEGSTAFCDHSHKLEKIAGLRASIRGLLCLYCNRRILVVLHDNEIKAQRAADYLRDPPARRLFGLDLLIALAARPDV
ncbi:MAG: endonuclease domain-containing protein [Egibacteraceae bacterium]